MLQLALGTAQFGSAYGITNKDGKIKSQEMNNILDAFFLNGYSFIDTALEYGNAHQIIASWKNIKSEYQ